MSTERQYYSDVKFDLSRIFNKNNAPTFAPAQGYQYPFVSRVTGKPMDPYHYHGDNTLAYKLGRDVRDAWLTPMGHASRRFWSEPLYGLGGGAALGALGGFFGGRALLPDRPILSTILGALLGAGTAGGITYAHDMTKKAFVSPMQGGMPSIDDPAVVALLNKVRASNQINFAEKESLISMIKSLNLSQLTSLASITKGLSVSAIVFVVAKFLAGLGMKTSLVSALLSGAAASILSTSNKNQFGQTHLKTHNNFGKQYFLG